MNQDHTQNPIFDNIKIANLNIKNRIFRAATSETAAEKNGNVSEKLIEFYAKIAKGKPGLIFTGHMYVEIDGQYAPFQTGITLENELERLKLLTSVVHKFDVPIIAELSHCGSQTMMSNVVTKSPSILPNLIYGNQPCELSETEIQEIIEKFKISASIAMKAGFDGIHIHGGNGYLISQFSSPISNNRKDKWGGNERNRDRFFIEIYKAIRKEIGKNRFISARVGVQDVRDNGLSIQEGINRVKKLEMHGLNAVEPTYNLMNTYKDNIKPFAGNDIFKSIISGTFLFDGFKIRNHSEGYYSNLSKELSSSNVEIPKILVGGIRTTAFMKKVLKEGKADFFALSRPFIREPELVLKIKKGYISKVACVSCNMCFKHEGFHQTQCWRKNIFSIVKHLIFNFKHKLNN
jgi:2,4-dienoyl-CoA reductase-like NADH-dependent reductase (Old Yellow Enzyme family)